ncbi:hypothetical protein P3T36_004206 [Kitasatospora sp. MAP12-15]|uniref:hypothetical protein n=1 Tax=unclassified Kitasatospora TaxID=2633591 RepID=UPI0024753991|nr:hypothetical protein [Kitasatospora sp. MAP12-44]MDH6108329.1 hypothetical protein [Kitasatospora sp. MAP12-44]
MSRQLRCAVSALALAVALAVTTAPAQAAGYPDAPCGTVTAADSTLAAQLNPTLTGTLAAAMTANRVSCAQTILSTVRARGLSDQAAVIAVDTAITASELDPALLNGTSAGLYQQADTAGTQTQRLDPAWSTGTFLDAMLATYPNSMWQTMAVGDVCSGVQHYPFPGPCNAQAADAQLIINALNGQAGTTPPPSPAANNANTVHLVNITPDGGLHFTEGDYAAGSWAGWNDLGVGGVKAVTSAATGSVNRIFIIGGDNNIYENDGDYAAGTWSGWQRLAGAPQVTSIAASSFGSRVHLDVVETDGRLYNSDKDFPGGQWNGFSLVGGSNLVKVASASTANNVNHIFALDAGNRLWEVDANYAAGTWGNLADAAGGFQGIDVTAAAYGDTVHLDAIDTNGTLFNTEGDYDKGTWNGWSAVNGATGLKHVTSATSSVTDVNHIFAVSSSNSLIEIDADYNARSWNSWAQPAGGANSIGATASFTH